MSQLSIGDLAKQTGVKVVTIRYYEQIGLLPVPSRTASNYRAYHSENLHRLRFIRRCRDLGFTLHQVRDLLQLSSKRAAPCTEVDCIVGQHLRTIEDKLSDLKRLAAELHRISKCCRGGGKVGDCRIIEALSHGKSPGPGK